MWIANACEQARDEATAALADAQGRVFKLEVAVAEGQKQGQQVADLEKELTRYRYMHTIIHVVHEDVVLNL